MPELPASLARAFAAAALSPTLRSILIIDLDAGTLRAAAAALAQLLTIAEGRPAEVVSLASAQNEDALWGGLAIRATSQGPTVVWEPGLLTRELTAESVPVVVIPDLAHVGLLGQRTCVMAMDAPVAHLERHGQSRRWAPRVCWLAGCAAADAVQVSPHLLDRFAIRLDGQAFARFDRVAELRAALAEESPAPPALQLPAGLEAMLRAASSWPLPQLHAQFADAVLQLAPAEIAHGSARRQLALARLAIALARLEGAPEALPAHVLAAHRLRRPQAATTTRSAEGECEPQQAKAEQAAPPQPAQAPSPALPTARADVSPEPAPAAASDGYVSAQGAPLPGELAGGEAQALSALNLRLFPEDGPRQQAAEPLRIPPRRFRASASASGPVIGVEQSDTTEDLALVATIVEAARWQRMRRNLRPDLPLRLQISPADLRRNRRAPVVEQLLLLVIDHTCRAGFDWIGALMPHLLWAYQERAAVSLVQVGAAGAAHTLRAELLSVPHVLVPQLNLALNAGPGYGTPLAHGLDLALQALRRAVQGGRSAVRRARLVVLSDGRGNIPLDASRVGLVAGTVGLQGVEAALEAAQALSRLALVQRLLIAPQPQLYPELARRLAVALDAPLTLMAPLQAEAQP